MHLAKELEFRAVAVMACDHDVVPLAARIEEATDPAELDETYATERHLLYVACTRARERLLVTGARPVLEFLDDLGAADSDSAAVLTVRRTVGTRPFAVCQSAYYIEPTGKVHMSQVLERSDRSAPFDAGRLEAVGLKAFGRVMDAWKVRNADAAALLGVSGRTWSRAKTGEGVRLTADNLDRISAVVGIYKGLHLYFSDALADRWVRLENEGPPFQGQTPLAYMTDGLPNLLATRAYVDALRGGL